MRMQEGSLALSNMSRFVVAINELKKNNLPYIVVLTNPSTGGTLASLGMLGDITMAEKGCLVAFSGARVIQATVKEELPPDFQTAEYVKKHEFIDTVVERKDLKDQIGTLLSILLKKNSEVNSEENETSETNFETTAEAS